VKALSLVLLFIVSSLGCAENSPPRGEGGIPDSGLDGAMGDGGMDAGLDGGTDAETDSGTLECGELGCGWCASRGRCVDLSESCAFEGRIASELCWDRFEPCTIATCWDPDVTVYCADQLIPEDFASGRFNVHEYSTTLSPGEPITIELTQTAGSFEPAIFIRDPAGVLLYGGDPETLDPSVSILMAESGRGGTYASVTLQTSSLVDAFILVTGWSVVDSEFADFLPTDAEYDLRIRQECDGSDSESVGTPSAGSLENGARINDGPGYVVADTGRNAYYGTQETVDLLRSGLAHVLSRHPGAQVVQVRDISVIGGGEPSGTWPHASHESGRDVDMTYHLASCSPTSGCPISDVSLSEFDAAATWTLFEYWIDLGVLTYIFVDALLQEALRGEAMARGATAAELDRWIQWPRKAGTSDAIIRHVANHLNHHHVRFTCPVDDLRCVE
jgi:hypothetical protein